MAYKHPSGEEFQGVIGRTVSESKPWWPESEAAAGLAQRGDGGARRHRLRAPRLLRLDHRDARTSTRWPRGGLRFTGFHTTALCSPTRACLLTGRNHHAVGMRAISNFDTGFPNMRGAIPRSAATLAEILRDNGYATFAAGKWHLAPMAECSAAGPYTNWPLQKGFDRYYGFLQGETDQFFPELTCDNHFVDPPGHREDGYHVSEDIVDRSAGMDPRPDLAGARAAVLPLPGVRRDALAAPGARDAIWRSIAAGSTPAGTWRASNGSRGRRRWASSRAHTRLAPHNPGVNPWTDLSENEQRLRRAAAGSLRGDARSHRRPDRPAGRVPEVDRPWDNTLFILLSDNGASQEGGPTGVLDEMKWFNGMRENARRGGAAARRHRRAEQPLQHPLGLGPGRQHAAEVVQAEHPRRRRARPADHALADGPGAPGETRDQFCHAIDVAPTILDLLGIEPPEMVAGVPQMPVHGVSLAAALADPAAATAARGRNTSRCSAIAASGRTAGRPSRTTTPGTPFDDDAGSSTTSPRTSRSTTTWRRPNRAR